jgi:hypothetical protein
VWRGGNGVVVDTGWWVLMRRTGMWQILFKSKCDNQLNEVKESVATEIREVCGVLDRSVIATWDD